MRQSMRLEYRLQLKPCVCMLSKTVWRRTHARSAVCVSSWMPKWALRTRTSFCGSKRSVGLFRYRSNVVNVAGSTAPREDCLGWTPLSHACRNSSTQASIAQPQNKVTVLQKYHCSGLPLFMPFSLSCHLCCPASFNVVFSGSETGFALNTCPSKAAEFLLQRRAAVDTQAFLFADLCLIYLAAGIAFTRASRSLRPG